MESRIRPDGTTFVSIEAHVVWLAYYINSSLGYYLREGRAAEAVAFVQTADRTDDARIFFWGKNIFLWFQ